MKILIVDDEAGALRDLSRAVEKVQPGEELFSARDGETALALCREQALGVVFLDISMPDVDGLTLARKIRSIRPLVNLIMVTAHPNYALDAFRLYVSDYILKPASPEALKRALSNLRNPVDKIQKGLFVRCFGNFEVFYDGKPVRFGRAKIKELFAYLIDRRGTSVTNAELRAILWGDEVRHEDKQRRYFAQLIYELQGKLSELGLSDLFLHSRDSYAIVPEKIPCDYYLALQQDPEAMYMYQGEYMKQYEWAEYWDRTGIHPGF